MIERTGEHQRVSTMAALPEMADELADVVLDPPDKTFTDTATVEFGGRTVELRYLGRGHTDNDIVIVVGDADVVCAGDLLENGAPPYFGDGFPMDWPATAAGLLELVGERTVVVPGHGDPAGREFAATSLAAFQDLAALARRVHAGELDLVAAVEQAPYGGGCPPATARAWPSCEASWTPRRRLFAVALQSVDGRLEPPAARPTTLGELRASGWQRRSVKEEMRANLLAGWRRRSRSSRASSATTSRSSRPSRTPCWPARTSASWASAARPRPALPGSLIGLLDDAHPGRRGRRAERRSVRAD